MGQISRGVERTFSGNDEGGGVGAEVEEELGDDIAG
jgi:hypothetical protein